MPPFFFFFCGRSLSFARGGCLTRAAASSGGSFEGPSRASIHMSFLGRWARKTARFTDALKDFAPASREVVAGFAHHDDVTARWRAWSDDQHGGKSRAALTWIPRTPRGAEHEDEDVGAMVLEGEVSTPDSSPRAGSRGVALVRAEWALWVPSDAVDYRGTCHTRRGTVEMPRCLPVGLSSLALRAARQRLPLPLPPRAQAT